MACFSISAPAVLVLGGLLGVFGLAAYALAKDRTVVVRVPAVASATLYSSKGG